MMKQDNHTNEKLNQKIFNQRSAVYKVGHDINRPLPRDSSTSDNKSIAASGADE